jgi:hypothetical protein
VAFLFVMAVAMVLVIACILIHYEIMRITADLLLPRLTAVPRRAHVAFGITACFVAHTLEVWLFALVYFGLAVGTNSGFSDEQSRHFPDYVYFSTETYTSLGFGDMRLLSNDLRLLAGVEAMVGLVLLAWTASFSYFLMARYWLAHPKRGRHPVIDPDQAESDKSLH